MVQVPIQIRMNGAEQFGFFIFFEKTGKQLETSTVHFDLVVIPQISQYAGYRFPGNVDAVGNTLVR